MSCKSEVLNKPPFTGVLESSRLLFVTGEKLTSESGARCVMQFSGDGLRQDAIPVGLPVRCCCMLDNTVGLDSVFQ